MNGLIGIFADTTLVEIELLLASFLLCSLIGIERQLRQKAAGFRTHVLVGMGSCAFTLVSVFGFSAVLGEDVVLDPSRIAAQIVSGIGFLGAGVIFKGRNVVRGLTTAATIWVAAAVGMACGAGMLSLGFMLTALHLLTLFVVAPLVRRLPSPTPNGCCESPIPTAPGCCATSWKSRRPWASLILSSTRVAPPGSTADSWSWTFVSTVGRRFRR